MQTFVANIKCANIKHRSNNIFTLPTGCRVSLESILSLNNLFLLLNAVMVLDVDGVVVELVAVPVYLQRHVLVLQVRVQLVLNIRGGSQK